VKRRSMRSRTAQPVRRGSSPARILPRKG
jgi:hypothetical protein